MKIFLFVLAATIFEAAGDALLRNAIHSHVWSIRIGYFLTGAVLLTLYGTSLNLAPVEFGKVVGLYVALLYIVFQVTNYIAFKAKPTLPVLVGGVLIVAGGLLTILWQRPAMTSDPNVIATQLGHD
ncbi:hypothetical protein [Terriglobus sp.]|uniref:hypothetical protein n=1 Tax=Terriglobus sp. TaxID=1889013 RepID=UPI003B0089C7